MDLSPFFDGIGHRFGDRQEVIEHRTAEACLGLLVIRPARAQCSPNQPFVTPEMRFNDRAAVIPARLFPLAPTLASDRPDGFIPGEGWGVTISVRFNFRVPARGNAGVDRHALFGTGQGLKALAFILGAIGREGLHRRGDWIEQGRDLRGVIPTGRGQGLRDDFAGGFMDADVPFTSGTPLAPPMLTDFPFAFSIDF